MSCDIMQRLSWVLVLVMCGSPLLGSFDARCRLRGSLRQRGRVWCRPSRGARRPAAPYVYVLTARGPLRSCDSWLNTIVWVATTVLTVLCCACMRRFIYACHRRGGASCAGELVLVRGQWVFIFLYIS
jgi:hypothetical protein